MMEICAVEKRLAELGIVLPTLMKPRGSFAAFSQCDKVVYLSGKGSPMRVTGTKTLKVGHDVSVVDAQLHAREVAIYLLAVMRVAAGGFINVKQLVKVFGMVNAAPDFTEHTEVINGASDLFVQVLGERGVHARSAIGVGSLPRGFAVEIEAVFHVV
jgi:enamine deaminase RidA (YjgF/YER057c/UK114 family)